MHDQEDPAHVLGGGVVAAGVDVLDHSHAREGVFHLQANRLIRGGPPGWATVQDVVEDAQAHDEALALEVEGQSRLGVLGQVVRVAASQQVHPGLHLQHAPLDVVAPLCAVVLGFELTVAEAADLCFQSSDLCLGLLQKFLLFLRHALCGFCFTLGLQGLRGSVGVGLLLLSLGASEVLGGLDFAPESRHFSLGTRELLLCGFDVAFGTCERVGLQAVAVGVRSDAGGFLGLVVVLGQAHGLGDDSLIVDPLVDLPVEDEELHRGGGDEGADQHETYASNDGGVELPVHGAQEVDDADAEAPGSLPSLVVLHVGHAFFELGCCVGSLAGDVVGVEGHDGSVDDPDDDGGDESQPEGGDGLPGGLPRAVVGDAVGQRAPGKELECQDSRQDDGGDPEREVRLPVEQVVTPRLEAVEVDQPVHGLAFLEPVHDPCGTRLFLWRSGRWGAHSSAPMQWGF